ncbi:hypothetical protein AQUCO_01800052v1 [Aquilegia coerulea]|uniref:hAT-like transposase RNase-H fold domain-containing protein n=1 Tax=Aquilegia coerulea TaxID=218851 RepID=A0A2G5DKF3_AQUCA|nr:hypothetical protein AQUCO_01800052v1 [Aquilegia coerulea]
MKVMVQRMKEKFDKYWKESGLLMVIAALLDPRNKMMHIEYVFEKLYGLEEVETKLQYIRAELHNLYDDYVAMGTNGGNSNIG